MVFGRGAVGGSSGFGGGGGRGGGGGGGLGVTVEKGWFWVFPVISF